jgi:hypothetical protein
MDLDFKDPPRGMITSGFLSKHFGTDKNYNEQNHGIGYMHPDGWLGGMYNNSLGKTSLYAGKEFRTPLTEQLLDLGLILGLVSGYGGGLKPMAFPEIMAKWGQNEVALGAIPPIKNVTPATLALQYRRKF